MDLKSILFLYQYNCWANSRILEVASVLTPEQFSEDLGISHRSIQGTLAHILGAEWIWLKRCEGTSPRSLPAVQDFPSVKALTAGRLELEKDYNRYLENLTDRSLDKVIRYTNIKGEEWAYPLGQILQHVWNHSTYHRGQVTSSLRQLGVSAVETDLLVFVDQSP